MDAIMKCFNKTWKTQSGQEVLDQTNHNSDVAMMEPGTKISSTAILASGVYDIDVKSMRPTMSFNDLRGREPHAGTSHSLITQPQHNERAGGFPRHGGVLASTAASRGRTRGKTVMTGRVEALPVTISPANSPITTTPPVKPEPGFFTVSPGIVGICPSAEVLRAERWDKWWAEQQAIEIDPTYEKWLKKDEWCRRWRVDTKAQSGATSPTSLKLSIATGAAVDFYEEELIDVFKAIDSDRIQTGIWHYLNEQIKEMIDLCDKARDWRENPPTSDVREACGKRFNELFLSGGKHIELQPSAVRGDLWQHLFDQVAPDNVATPEAMKLDWAATWRNGELLGRGIL